MKNKIVPTLLTDFYKTIHHLSYVPGMEYLTSYWTPRKSRVADIDGVVMFGLQAYIKDFLIDYFYEYFFNRSYEDIHKEYKRVISNTMSEEAADDSVMRSLHNLGYLPIEIKALDEGTVAPIRCPMIQISNTVAGYGWLVNYLETPTSASIWHPMTTATIGYYFRSLVKKHFDKAVDEAIPYSSACGDFSMRGMTSIESALAASAGHLLSFTGTATIGAIPWLEEYYNCDCTKEVVGKGVPSMEHSVMESYGKENEFECYRHLIEDVFPKGPLSIVSDTWDYFNVLTVIIPALKNKILARNGKIIIRGDSGNPVDIICGTLKAKDYMTIEGLTESNIYDYFKKYGKEDNNGSGAYIGKDYTLRIDDYLYKITVEYEWVDDVESSLGGYYTDEVSWVSFTKEEITPEMKGTIEILWDIFKGKINSKGYKVLDSHIGAIYGDSITPTFLEEIYTRLEDKGFAPNNCTLGIGSYTYQYVTRDTLGFALKATHCVVNGEEKIIFKDPITDKRSGDNFKKSQKGLCYVYKHDGEISYKDELLTEDINKLKSNLLTPVFKDGVILKEFSLSEIRNCLHDNKF